MYVTPGPNNAMVLASGLKFGFLKTIPHMIWHNYWSCNSINFGLSWIGKNFSNISRITKYTENYCAIYLFILVIK